MIWSHSLSDMFLKLGRMTSVRVQKDNQDSSQTHPLSRRIPALFMRMVTPPNASRAVLITAAPSVTDEVFVTALPPAVKVSGLLCREGET